MAHKHKWQLVGFLVPAQGRKVEVRWWCTSRGCQGTKTQDLAIRKPGSTAKTDAERSEAEVARKMRKHLKEMDHQEMLQDLGLEDLRRRLLPDTDAGDSLQPLMSQPEEENR